MTTRRDVLGALAVVATSAGALFRATAARAAAFEVMHTPAEWKAKLTAAQYDVLRDSGTERPFTSPLLQEHRAGTFTCAGCDRDLFASDTKFESGTGWPSFYAPLPHAVETSNDTSAGMVRDEVPCRRCGGHLGAHGDCSDRRVRRRRGLAGEHAALRRCARGGGRGRPLRQGALDRRGGLGLRRPAATRQQEQNARE